MNALIEFLCRFAAVDKCAFCGKVLFAGHKDALCEDCRKAYEALRLEPCTLCKQTASYCHCMSQTAVHFDRAVQLIFYGSPLSHSIMEALKYGGFRRTTDFLGAELARAVLLEKGSRDLSDFYVTWVPRSQKNYRKYGFDQSYYLSCVIAKELNLTTLNTLMRKGGIRQKTASFEKRKKNAQKSIFLRSAPVAGKRFLLVDDVTTTGSTLAACTALLRKAGAIEVWAVTVAKTQKIKTDANTLHK